MANQQQIRSLKAHLENLSDMGVSEIRRRPAAAPVPKAAKTVSSSGGGDKTAALKAVRDLIGDCKLCRLCETRNNIVFGVGNPNSRLMFIGEAPGRDEDLKAEPFVGRAGQLLTKMIEAMGYQRSDIYIANIVKCRPPDNRYPESDEVENCMPFLLKQIDAIKPEIIISLGNLATQTLLQTKTGITALHGEFKDFHGTKLMPTYHPAFLLRNPNMKKPCWEDLKKVMAELKKKSA